MLLPNKQSNLPNINSHLSELYTNWDKKYMKTKEPSQILLLRPLYDQIEKNNWNGIASKTTNLGQDEGKLTVLNTKVYFLKLTSLLIFLQSV
jgi:hypothetical protein